MMLNFSPKAQRTAKDNLMDQANALVKNARIKGIKTRVRYLECFEHFAQYYADEWHGQKVANISAKHIYGYTEYMKDVKHYSPSTIRCELSGIRFVHKLSGSKNILPDNKVLDLGKCRTGTVDRAWLPHEIESAKSVAKEMGRYDVFDAIELGQHFGLRIHEIAKIRVNDIREALYKTELQVKGKGGQTRSVPVETKEQLELLKRMNAKAQKFGLHPSEYAIAQNQKYGVQREMESLENWLRNNRHKFTDKDRKSKVDPGNKERYEHLTWHGLRYYYAQNREKRLTEEGRKNVARNVSESLGHHRISVTKIYLAEQPQKTK